MKSVNPATGNVNKEFKKHDHDQCREQAERSRKAYKTWRSTPLRERLKTMENTAKVLRQKKEELAKTITIEMGKPIKESNAEIEKCAWVCEYYAENSEEFLKEEEFKTDSKRSYVRFDPLGVVFGIMPWNFPFWQVFRFAVPALSAGNAVLLKHASNVPLSSLAIEEVFMEAGVPEDVFKSLLIGSDVASKLIEEDLVDAVSLTGSEGAGRAVGELAGKNILEIVLELGGSDAFVVLEDADIAAAAKAAATSRMINCGQSCIAAKRFIVHEAVADEFKEKMVEEMKGLKQGDPLDEKTDVGPLAQEQFVDDIDRQVKESVKQGASVLLGGKRGDGAYYPPTVLSDVTREMAVMTEETFGPVAPIITVKDEDEAIEIANDSPYGLGGNIWTGDLERGQRLAGKMESGSVFVNGFTKSDPRVPFGGIKKSGVGRELSHYGLKEFTNIKTVVVE